MEVTEDMKQILKLSKKLTYKQWKNISRAIEMGFQYTVADVLKELKLSDENDVEKLINVV